MDAISDVSRGSQIFSTIPNRDPLPEPVSVDELLGFADAIRNRDFRRGLLEDAEEKSGLGKSKIFINNVGSYIGKYLVSVLSRKEPEMDLIDSKQAATEALLSPTDVDTEKRQPKLGKESSKSSTRKEKSPKQSKSKGDKSPKKAASKKDKSPAKSKVSKKGGKGKEPESPKKPEIDLEEFEETVEEDNTIPYDTSKLTVPEYYELMDLESGDMRNKYLEEKVGKYLPNSFPEIKTITSMDKSVKYNSKKIIYTSNLEIIGTLRKEGPHEVPEGVKEIIQVSEYDEEFIKTLAECAAVVYVINEDFEQIHEASWVLTGLINLHEELKTSDKPHENSPPLFILVSTFMTWSLTKPFDPNQPDLPFIEKDYRKRTPHPNYQHHYGLEEQIIQLKSNGCVEAVIVTCGIPYGHEESTLKYLFQMAFNCNDLPVFEPGSNYLPLVHVEHLGLIIKQVLKTKGDVNTPFIFAIDPVSYQTMREIVEVISCQFGNGCVRKISRLFGFMRDEITQDIYDELNANIVLDSCYPLYKEEDIKWKYESGFIANIKDIVEEYTSVHNLVPLRIAFYYSHEEFKEVAQKLSDHYNVPLVTPRRVIQEYVNEVLEKVNSLAENKESPRLEIYEELNDNKECKDESLNDAVNLLKHLDVKQVKDTLKLSGIQRISILKEALKKRWYLNRGFILDNFPRTSEGTKGLFSFNEDHNSKQLRLVETTHLPNYIIYLKYLEENALSDTDISHKFSLDESMEEELDVDDEERNSLIESYQEENVTKGESLEMKKKAFKKLPSKVVEFFLENNSTCRIIKKEIKDAYNANAIFKDLVKAINYSTDQEMVESKSSSHQEVGQGSLPERIQSLAEEKKTDSIKVDTTESMRQEEYALLKENEEHILAIRSVPYIKYLINYIFPTLTNAILEVCDARPKDPLDVIAEYLFKNNPEGRMLDPTDEIRRKELLEKSKGVVKVDSKACLA